MAQTRQSEYEKEQSELMRHEKTVAALPVLLVPWYRENKRDLPWRRTRDPYRIFLAEIMLQQTRVGAVLGYYERFLAAFPTVQALSAADDEALMKAWEGLGYYSRARNLKRAATQICERHGGVFPDDFAALRTLSGVGDYTAGAVASIAFSRPVAAVDGNVLRVLSRVTERKTPISEAYKKAAADALTRVYPRDACGDFTQSFMDLGSAICLPKKPLCAACPLSSVCLGHRRGTADTLPVRKEKPARPTEQRTVFVLRHGNRIALLKRPDTGILAGLWELPNTVGALTEQQAAAAIRAFRANVAGEFTVRHRKHVFTHLCWELTVFDAQITEECPPFVWVDPDRNETALPTAFKICLT